MEGSGLLVGGMSGHPLEESVRKAQRVSSINASWRHKSGSSTAVSLGPGRMVCCGSLVHVCREKKNLLHIHSCLHCHDLLTHQCCLLHHHCLCRCHHDTSGHPNQARSSLHWKGMRGLQWGMKEVRLSTLNSTCWGQNRPL